MTPTTKYMSYETIISELLAKNPNAVLFEPREDLDKAVIGCTTGYIAIYDPDLLEAALADSFVNGSPDATDEEKESYERNGVLDQDVDEWMLDNVIMGQNQPVVIRTLDPAPAPDGDLRLN